MKSACERRKKMRRVGKKKRNGNAHWNMHEERPRRGDWKNRPIKIVRRERLHLKQFVG